MITTTIGQLAGTIDALSALASLPLNAKNSYHVMRIVRAVSPDVQLFTDQKNKLIIRMGTERDATPEEQAAGMGTKVHVVEPEKVESFSAEFQALSDVAVTIDLAPITLAMLGECAIEPKHLLALGPLFDGEAS